MQWNNTSQPVLRLQHRGLWFGQQHELTAREIHKTGWRGIFCWTPEGECLTPTRANKDVSVGTDGTGLSCWKYDLSDFIGRLLFSLVEIWWKWSHLFYLCSFWTHHRVQWEGCDSVPPVIYDRVDHDSCLRCVKPCDSADSGHILSWQSVKSVVMS